MRDSGVGSRSGRVRRRLSSAERRALEAMNELGAGIGDDFSGEELRSAFRALARRYHPDRHPAASEVERRRLSQQFTAIRSSYDLLRSTQGSSHL